MEGIAAPEEAAKAQGNESSESFTTAAEHSAEPAEYNEAGSNDVKVTSAPAAFDISAVPAYSDKAYVSVNGNEPYFNADEMNSNSY